MTNVGMRRADLVEEIEHRELLLVEARAERDRFEQAIRWALGEMVAGETFPSAKVGDPPYWWRRGLRERAGL